MKKNFISHLLQTGCIFSIACLTACGPVHRFTRVKNVPREYVRNYSVEGVKAPRSLSLFKRNPWIVFAKEQGTSYLSPSGKNEMQAVEYMDAFLVIKRKGDWLKLIQYNPAILKNGKLKEWKQAQYCGWMNQNDLLLTRSGFTDVLTGFKNKQVVMLSDTVALANPSAYFTNDSVKLFENTDLTQEAGKIPLYSIVYPYKISEDKGCVLVANKPQLDADSIGQTVRMDRQRAADRCRATTPYRHSLAAGQYAHLQRQRTKGHLAAVGRRHEAETGICRELSYHPVQSGIVLQGE